MDLVKLEAILFEELNRTKDAYEEARAEFFKISADIPSGLPAPDGAQRISNAGNRKSTALRDYGKAIRECNDFLLDGAVPERFRDSGDTS